MDFQKILPKRSGKDKSILEVLMDLLLAELRIIHNTIPLFFPFKKKKKKDTLQGDFFFILLE